MTPSRALVVNADDFGMTAGINRGIVEAHEHGIVTSASMMVRGPAAEDAAELAKHHRRLSVGLHVDVAEWIFQNGEWVVGYKHADPEDADSVRAEVMRQLDRFGNLFGRLPTHIDSHQHLHRDDPLKSVLVDLSSELSLPLRWFGDVNTCGAFYGQEGRGGPLPGNITVDFAISLIDSFPTGVTELVCHPGYGEDLASSYADEREIELATLCDPRLRDALRSRQISLISFADVV